MQRTETITTCDLCGHDVPVQEVSECFHMRGTGPGGGPFAVDVCPLCVTGGRTIADLIAAMRSRRKPLVTGSRAGAAEWAPGDASL